MTEIIITIHDEHSVEKAIHRAVLGEIKRFFPNTPEGNAHLICDYLSAIVRREMPCNTGDRIIVSYIFTANAAKRITGIINLDIATYAPTKAYHHDGFSLKPIDLLFESMNEGDKP
ncbi:MAG TPA: hypothetical protein PKX17_03760 [Candidatus Methanomethylicus sp.]|nr:hypothetical protein [Candidatus Methanomethylicus sp.]